MFPYTDTSKQLHRLRQKISHEKAALAKLVCEYNELPTTECSVELANALENKFPWALHVDDDNERKLLLI